jgi:tetratricopeptide (TPR) repeat protein
MSIGPTIALEEALIVQVLNNIMRSIMRSSGYAVIALLLFGTCCGVAGTTEGTLVDSSWQVWQAQNYAIAEKQLRGAIAAEPSDARAYISLALLENSRGEYRQSWDALRLLSERNPDIYPYLFSFWQTIRFRLKNDFAATGLLEYLEKLTTRADSLGILPPQTAEALEEYYRERHKLSRADDWHAKINAVSDWMLIGPFENVSASGYEKAYPPEREFDPGATYEGKGGIPAGWFPIASPVPDTWVDFTKHFGFKESIFYANTFVYSPARRNVHLRVGTSGSLRAFLNDRMVIEYFDENNNDLDTYNVATELQQGWNRILIKCGCSEIDKCNFLVRITDEHGEAVEGLRVSREAQTYSHGASAPAVLLENPFESFFNKQLGAYPDRAENYALLAQVYLRDDKAPQAEGVLRSALKRWPRCALFYTLLMEAYQRGQKSDETDELVARLAAIDAEFPEILAYRVNEAVRNEEFQKADELIARLKNQGYNPESVYDMEISLLGKQKEIDRVVALVAEAHAKYPLNWSFTDLQALVESEIHHDPARAAGVVNAALNESYGVQHLLSMANYYLKAGQVDKWEEAMKEAIDREPESTGYFYSMGLVYQLTKNYGKAEAAFRRALALCPGSGVYLSKLAEVLKTTGRMEEARTAYVDALKFDPRDFAAREALRALDGKKPIFAAFTSYNIDSLVHAAPAKKSYENDDGVILLDDTKRVVFERGASMAISELLVKAFSTRGIDTWKEYDIGYNRYNEELIVEKAVTIKKDGTEVKADVNRGEVVFKSLEPNDCIYLKWKLKNYYRGMLAKHFWDVHLFNQFFPVRISRYSLMVPKGAQFMHRVQFSNDVPSVRQVDDGELYEWQVQNEPAVRYEQGMPVFSDVGKILYVSSLPSWEYIASWYSDLARTKTRPTFEIRNQVASLLDGKAPMSDEEKLEAIYGFITENIRYSSVSFRQSGFVPQRARDVLVQRLGDCKDMATLCIAMLGEAGIKSHYVLVNTWDEGFNRNILPGISFNHCIVGVDLKGGVRHIDLTAANFPMGSIPPVDKGAFSLAIDEGSRAPTHLAPGQFQSNNLLRVSRATLNDDNSMTSVCSSRRTGAFGARVRSQYRNKSKADCIKALTESLGSDYPNIEVKDFTITDVDRLECVLEDTQEYRVPQFMSDAGGFKLMRMPWKDRLSPAEGLSYNVRTYPFMLGIVGDTLSETSQVRVPAGYVLKEVPRRVRLSDSAATYSVDYKYAQGVLTGTRTLVYRNSMVSPAAYAGFKKFYNEAMKEDNRQLLLSKSR